MTIKKIGFACKLSEMHPTKGIVGVEGYNTGSTTVAWLSRQSKTAAEEKLLELVKDNIESVRMLVAKVASFPEELRMVRIGSDVLPMYTHRDWKYFYDSVDIIKYMEKAFARVGEIARAGNVRLSFHPGQFTVLASTCMGIVENSIEEFEYHTDMARWMGYGKTFQDLKINVHISGKQGPEGIRLAYKRLSPEARNCITIENEENSWGLEDCLTISDIVPIVLDIHHNFIREGEYIQPTDEKYLRVIDSWRGVRPTIHYSMSREDCLVGHCPNTLPNMELLLAQGYKKQKMRAHSDFYWNIAANKWALSFLDTADIMAESKAKNLASFALYKQYKNEIYG